MAAVILQVTDGDMFQEQDADAFVNAYNRNFIPWWLLLPQGVSGRLKRLGGTKPFRQLAKHGHLRLGEAVLTDGGKLPQRIVHVAGINNLWKASQQSVEDSTSNALTVAWDNDIHTLVFPVVGAGHGGLDEQQALEYMTETVTHWTPPSAAHTAPLTVRIVRYRPKKK